MAVNHSQRQKTERFRDLHANGCFLMPNPWDAGTAKCLASLGFEALATTSAGFSFARGRPDAVGSMSVEEVLANTVEIVAATDLPVNVDFQDGYAREPEGVAANVARCLATGAAGLSIEDASGDASAPLYEHDLAVERIRAARVQVDESGTGVLLTARCEAALVGDPTPLKTAMKRLLAYAEAGAGCLFAPGIIDPDDIAMLVDAVAPVPLNVLVSQYVPGLDVRSLTDLGVRRISVGSALNRVAWKAFLDASSHLLLSGSFEPLDASASFNDLNRVFTSEH